MFDQIGARTHDLPHSRRAHEPIHHRRGLYDMKLILINVKYVSFRFPVSVFIYIYIRYIYTLICCNATATGYCCFKGMFQFEYYQSSRKPVLVFKIKSVIWLAYNYHVVPYLSIVNVSFIMNIVNTFRFKMCHQPPFPSKLMILQFIFNVQWPCHSHNTKWFPHTQLIVNI